MGFPVWSLVLGFGSQVLLCINSSVNFIIYCCLGAKFREVMKKYLCRIRPEAKCVCFHSIRTEVGGKCRSCGTERIGLDTVGHSNQDSNDKRPFFCSAEECKEKEGQYHISLISKLIPKPLEAGQDKDHQVDEKVIIANETAKEENGNTIKVDTDCIVEVKEKSIQTSNKKLTKNKKVIKRSENFILICKQPKAQKELFMKKKIIKSDSFKKVTENGGKVYVSDDDIAQKKTVYGNGFLVTVDVKKNNNILSD